jgi:plastocyanin
MINVFLFVIVAAFFTAISIPESGKYFTAISIPESGKYYVAAQEAVSIAPGSSNPSASQFYVPSEITVSSGTIVTWTNDDSTIHTVTDKGGKFDSSIIAPTATWKNTFHKAGEFDYYCTLHPFMTGKVIVT